MSALAQFQAMTGGRVSGSDRAFDRGERAGLRAQLERLGIAVLPQDGSGLGSDCVALVVSTAVEDHVPDVAAARANGIPIIHRSELLAHFVARHRSIAITGTSGKSTVTAMVFALLKGAGRDPSVITGGELPELEAQGLPGNAFAGSSDLLVVEADESDGSLVRYAPAIGVLLNLQRDHKEMTEVAAMFATLRARVRETLVVADAGNLDQFAGGGLPVRLERARRCAGRRCRAWPGLQPVSRGRHDVRAKCAGRAQCRQRAGSDRRLPCARRGARRHGGAARKLPRHRPAIPDDRPDTRRRGDRRFRAQCREDRRGDQDRQAARAARAGDLSTARLWADPFSAPRLRHHLHPRAWT